MATRLPLVLSTDGQVEQLPVGDSISIGPTLNVGGQVSVTAANSIPFLASSMIFNFPLGNGITNVRNILGGNAGDLLILVKTDAARNVRIRKNQGNIRGGFNRTLNNEDDSIMLMNIGGTEWLEINWNNG